MDIKAHLDRIDVKKMKNWELDAGFALAARLQVRVREDGAKTVVEAKVGRSWRPFSPTGSWQDFGVAAERVEIVFGTHMNGEPDAPWFSAHAFLSGTSFETRDGLRETAAMAATAYGKIRDWKFSETEQDDPISRASC